MALTVKLTDEHITRYGNKYSRAEWDAKKAVDAIRIPDEIARRCEVLHTAAWAALVAVIGDDAKATQVLGVARRYESLDEAEEYGRI